MQAKRRASYIRAAFCVGYDRSRNDDRAAAPGAGNAWKYQCGIMIIVSGKGINIDYGI